jgi:hypothetical protein
MIGVAQSTRRYCVRDRRVDMSGSE